MLIAGPRSWSLNQVITTLPEEELIPPPMNPATTSSDATTIAYRLAEYWVQRIVRGSEMWIPCQTGRSTKQACRLTCPSGRPTLFRKSLHPSPWTQDQTQFRRGEAILFPHKHAGHWDAGEGDCEAGLRKYPDRKNEPTSPVLRLWHGRVIEQVTAR